MIIKVVSWNNFYASLAATNGWAKSGWHRVYPFRACRKTVSMDLLWISEFKGFGDLLDEWAMRIRQTRQFNISLTGPGTEKTALIDAANFQYSSLSLSLSPSLHLLFHWLPLSVLNSFLSFTFLIAPGTEMCFLLETKPVKERENETKVICSERFS